MGPHTVTSVWEAKVQGGPRQEALRTAASPPPQEDQDLVSRFRAPKVSVGVQASTWVGLGSRLHQPEGAKGKVGGWPPSWDILGMFQALGTTCRVSASGCGHTCEPENCMRLGHPSPD